MIFFFNLCEIYNVDTISFEILIRMGGLLPKAQHAQRHAGCPQTALQYFSHGIAELQELEGTSGDQ